VAVSHGPRAARSPLTGDHSRAPRWKIPELSVSSPVLGERGTIIHVELRYQLPVGAVETTVGQFLCKGGERMLGDDLRAFKQILETGEILQSEASIHSKMHSAQQSRRPTERQLIVGPTYSAEKARA
jgi:hypothetical protein